MHTSLERLLRRLSETERMAVIVGVLVIAAMISAITLDHILGRTSTTPVVITMAPSPGASLEHVAVTPAP